MCNAVDSCTGWSSKHRGEELEDGYRENSLKKDNYCDNHLSVVRQQVAKAQH